MADNFWKGGVYVCQRVREDERTGSYYCPSPSIRIRHPFEVSHTTSAGVSEANRHLPIGEVRFVTCSKGEQLPLVGGKDVAAFVEGLRNELVHDQRQSGPCIMKVVVRPQR